MQKMHTLRFRLLIAAVLLATSPCCLFAKDRKSGDVWEIRENLVLRLSAEWFKIGVLTRELSSLKDVLSDIRDLELFPPELTRLNDATLIKFDKTIEALEKRRINFERRTSELQPPLFDGIAILREMVVGDPVESMFEVLEQGDLRRLSQMLEIKHGIDSLWLSTDTLLDLAMAGMGIPAKPKESSGVIDEEFFAILRANLGQQSEIYYEKLDRIKSQLIAKAGNASVREMFRIENRRIAGYLDEGNARVANTKIVSLIRRYEGRVAADELTMLLVRVQFSMGKYDEVLRSSVKLSDQGEAARLKLLYRLQSFYARQEYDSIWTAAEAFDSRLISGPKRNLLLWIIMESGLALGHKNAYTRLASHIDKNAPFALHIMHALGRSYVQSGDMQTALSVFESSMKFKTHSDNDKLAQRMIQVAIAETNYEMGNYEKALKVYFELLKGGSEFDRALFGILWCYINLNMDDKAEATLKKLINQNPSSPLAAEAILIMGKRFSARSRQDWKKMTYIAKEEQRLTSLVSKLAEKESTDTTHAKSSKYAYARQELRALLARVQREPRGDYQSIAATFDRAGKVCDMITSHYATGSFQEITFSEKREKLLHTLDSLMLASKEGTDEANKKTQVLSNARANRARIKETVARAQSYSTESLIDRYRWEREYVDWEKLQLQSRKQEINSKLSRTSDSTTATGLIGRLKQVESSIDSLLVAEAKLRKEWNNRLFTKISATLASGVDSTNAAYFHYHLGELFYERENAAYARLYDKYETELDTYRLQLESYQNGVPVERPREPIAPQLDHQRSSAQFRSVIRSPGNPDITAAAHYSLAWCFNDIAVFDSAIAHMEAVAANYASSSYAPQAWMYCGEYLFDKGDLSKSIRSYQSVMKYPESEWFDEALYKLAWAQYRMSNPEKAISSFLALVDLGEGSKGGRSLLEKESMDYIAISFSETDATGEKGLQSASAFVQKFGDQERGGQILHRLASVYKEQGRYDMAKKSYRTLLKTYPNYGKSPLVEGELLQVVERDLPTDEVSKMKVDFYKKYQREGEWAQAQTDRQFLQQADSVASKHLYDGAIGYHQLALQKNDSTVYNKALSAYDDYIRSYPNSPLANECHYNLAEIEFSLGDYQRAAEEYIAVSKRYPDSKYRETAAWNAIVASQNLLKKEESPKQ